MKKKLIIFTAFLALTLSVTACSGKSNPSDSAPSPTEQTRAAEQTVQQAQPAETADATDAADASSEGSITGIVQANKGFMITIVSDEDSEPYVFTLDDTQRETYESLKEGDHITVSYINGIPTPDNLETVVTDIKTVK